MREPNSESLQVRSMAHADLEQVLAWRNEPSVRCCMFKQHEITMAEHLLWFGRASLNPKKHLLIFEDNQMPLGFVNFNEVGNGGIADWGFFSAPDAPKGSGRKLGRVALNHGFTQLKFHKVCGQVLAYNERSIKLHQCLRFRQEGIMREQHFDGERYNDVICFGLLRKEWNHDSQVKRKK